MRTTKKLLKLTVLIFVFSATFLMAAPENDNFNFATLLTDSTGTVTNDNRFATSESGELEHAENSGPYHSIWYKWIALEDGTITINTKGSRFDTVLGMYYGSALNGLTEIASNDDEENEFRRWSQLTTNVIAGNIYYFVIDGFDSTEDGRVVLSYNFMIKGFSPLNDFFADAIVLSGSEGTNFGNSFNGTSETNEPQHAENDGPFHSVWWKWTAITNGTFNIKTKGSSFDTVLGMYSGNSLFSLVEIASNDDEDRNMSSWSELNVEVLAGETYYFAVDGFADDEFGEIILSWNFLSEALRPVNDDFYNAIEIVNFNEASVVTNIVATIEPGEPSHFGAYGPYRSVWWKGTASSNGIITVRTLGSDFDTVLAMYSGNSLTSLNQIASNDDFYGKRSQISTNIFAGETYYFAVDGYDETESGKVVLSYDFVATVITQQPPENSNFDNSTSLINFSGTVFGTNVDAPMEPGEPPHAGNGGPFHSVWWEWIAPSNGIFEIDTVGSDFDTVLAVYTGATVYTLTEIASNNDEPVNSANKTKTVPPQSQLSFSAIKDTVYKIVVDGATATDVGNIMFNFALKGAPPNDNFANAFILNNDYGITSGNNNTASAEVDEPEHAENFGPYHSLWYEWTAPENGTFSINTFESDFDTVIAMYQGGHFSTLVEVASNDDEDGGSIWSQFATSVLNGVTYKIAVDGVDDSETGNITLSWNFTSFSFSPTNDNFANAIVLHNNSGTQMGNCMNGTSEAGEPDHSGFGGPYNSVWWSWTAPANGLLIVDSEGLGFESCHAIYSGAAVDSLTYIDSDFEPDCQTSNSVIAGTTYYFAVDGEEAGQAGQITLSWQFSFAPEVINIRINNGNSTTTNQTVTLNNTCQHGPTEYMASEDSTFATAVWKLYSPTPTFELSAGQGNKIVYFKVRNANGESSFKYDNINLTVSPEISILAINNGAETTTAQTVTLNNACINNPSEYMVSENPSFAGASWIAYFVAPAFDVSAGCGTKTVYFKVRNAAGTSAIVNDSIYLTVSPEVSTFAINNGSETTTVQTVTLNNTCINNPSQYMASENPSFVGANWLAYSVAPAFDVSVGAGTKTIYFKVRNTAGESIVGNDSIYLRGSVPPINDDFVNAIILPNDFGNLSGNNNNATAEIDEPEHAENFGPYCSVWWKWTAQSNGTFSINTSGSDFDTVLGIYTGNSVDALTEIASNDDEEEGDVWSEIITNVIAGETYYFAVDGLDETETGNISLNWVFIPENVSPPNDDFVNAIELLTAIGTKSGNNFNGTIEIGEPDHAENGGPYHSVWWKFTAPNNGNINIRTEGSGFDTVLALYSGDTVDDLTEIVSNDDEEETFEIWSEISTNVLAGQTYYIAVDGLDDEELGQIILEWTFTPEDIPAPVIQYFEINSGSTSTTNQNVILTNSCINNPVAYMASATPDFTGANWKPYSEAPIFRLTPQSGDKTIYLKVRNSNGESAVMSDNISLVILPIVSQFSINDGKLSTTNEVVTLNNTCLNYPDEFLASENSDFSGASWIAYSSNPQFSLTGISGNKTVYFKVRNLAGESSAISDNINLILAPTVTGFVINNGDSATSNRLVTLNNSADNSPSHYMASEDENFSNTTWRTYSSEPEFFINSAGTGLKSIYFKVRNNSGESSTFFDDITLEKVDYPNTGDGFFMRIIETEVNVGDYFHIQLYSELETTWDYICQHIKKGSLSHGEFSFIDAQPVEIVPDEYFSATFAANLYDLKIIANSNLLNGVNDGILANIECQADKAGDVFVDYVARAGGVNFRYETCALTNDIDVLVTEANHLDGMQDFEFYIKPNQAEIILDLNSDAPQYSTGETFSVELNLSNPLTTEYNYVSLLLEYDSEKLQFVDVLDGELMPTTIEVDSFPNGQSNMISIVAAWDGTITDEGKVLDVRFFTIKNGKTRIIPIPPNFDNPSPYFGTTVIKNWVDVMDSPDTWTKDMPESVDLEIFPYENCYFIAEPDCDFLYVGENINIDIFPEAASGTLVDNIGIAFIYDSAHFDFVNLITASDILTNVIWEDEGGYVWLSADLLNSVSNLNLKNLATVVLKASNQGTARFDFQFLVPSNSFNQRSTFALWNNVDVLGDYNNSEDGVVGASVIVADPQNDIPAYMVVKGDNIISKGVDYSAAIVCLTNLIIDPDYISIEFAWNPADFLYKNYEIISSTASFSHNIDTNTGVLILSSDNINIQDCAGTVAVVRLTAIHEGSTQIELIAPELSAGDGTILLDAQANDLLGSADNPNDGMFGKSIIITETEAFMLDFYSEISKVKPGEEFFFDIILTNLADGFLYSNVAFMFEYDVDDVVILDMSNALLANAVCIEKTNFNDFCSMNFVWNQPTNVLGVLATIKAITISDFPIDFMFSFNNIPIGVFPGSYALNGNEDVLGSPEFDEDGVGDDLDLDNDGLPFGATLHFFSKTNVSVGEIFDGQIFLSNSAAVKVTGLNLIFEVEKESFEVESISQGNLGGIVEISDIDNMYGLVHYRESFDVPTLVSGVVCNLKMFTRGGLNLGTIESLAPSGEFDDDGTFVRNNNIDVLGWADDENDGGADTLIDIEVSENDFPILILDDYNEYEINSFGSMVVGDLGVAYLENRNIKTDSLIWKIEQVKGDKAEFAQVMPVPPYSLLIYPKVGSVGTQIFKVTVTDYENSSLYSYDYVGLIIDPTEELIYPAATDKITYTKPDYSYNSKSGKCSFENGVFNITGGSDKDSLIIKSIGNYESINSDNGLKKLSFNGSLNNLNIDGPIGSIIVKNGNLGNVTAESIKKISITAPRHYVKDEAIFDDIIDEPQGLVGSVTCEGDIGTIIVKSGDVGALDDREDYGQTIISKNGSIGKIITKGKKRQWFEKDYGLNRYFGGGNIYANILAPNGSIKNIMANNNIGWDNIDQPAIISAANDIKSIKLVWKKVRDGDAPTFFANVFSTSDVGRITIKSANFGTDDLQTTIKADSIKSVKCKLWRDYYLDDGDPWVDIYGGEFYANIIAENSIGSVGGGGDYFTSRILSGGDIKNIVYKGYKDEEGDLWGGDIEESFIAAGLNADGSRSIGSIKSVKAGNNILDSTIQAGCVYADPTPGYLGTIKKISAKASITDSVIGSLERPKFSNKQARARITYYINGTKQ